MCFGDWGKRVLVLSARLDAVTGILIELPVPIRFYHEPKGGFSVTLSVWKYTFRCLVIIKTESDRDGWVIQSWRTITRGEFYRSNMISVFTDDSNNERFFFEHFHFYPSLIGRHPSTKIIGRYLRTMADIYNENLYVTSAATLSHFISQTLLQPVIVERWKCRVGCYLRKMGLTKNSGCS